jgi:hypothetical protein
MQQLQQMQQMQAMGGDIPQEEQEPIEDTEQEPPQ